MGNNRLSTLPSTFGALTGLTYINLSGNDLGTEIPSEFRTINPSGGCFLQNNGPAFSCANVGAGTTCCTPVNCGGGGGGTSTCYSE